MPIIRMLSFVRDSFSFTIRKTVLYTGGMKMRRSRNGNTPVHTCKKGSVVFDEAGIGAPRSVMVGSALALGIFYSVSSFNTMFAARLCSIEYPLVM